METGLVRSILGIHFGRLHPEAMPSPTGDPNALVEAWTLTEALRQVAQQQGDGALRQAAADYAALWARTFPTLVRHLRGRPERALTLFAGEFYPFLRGDRLAARIESAEPGRATLTMLSDLPDAYLEGLVAAFVGLSGAKATCVAGGAGRFTVHYRAEAFDRLAQVVQELSVLRIPLVLAAVLAALVGVAMAAAEGDLAWLRVAAVLLGACAAQLGANAWHDLRHPNPAGPMRLMAPTRRRLLWQSRAGYGVAALCGAYLAVATPVVLAFAAAGLAVSTLFGSLRGKGWGPLLAGITYGPFVAAGAYHAFLPVALDAETLWAHFLPTVPLGLSAAAMLHLGDLADRPLDEAGGSRTLAVRLPRRRQAFLLDLLLVAAVASAALLAVLPGRFQNWTTMPILVAATFLATGVAATAHRRLDDPVGLAPARLAILLLHVSLAAYVVLAVLGVAP